MIARLFPAFAMKLLDFVGIYGMVLAPVGAIIVVDVFLADKLGIARDPAERFGIVFNPAALLAWVLPAAAGFRAVKHFAMPLPTYATLPRLVRNRPGLDESRLNHRERPAHSGERRSHKHILRAHLTGNCRRLLRMFPVFVRRVPAGRFWRRCDYRVSQISIAAVFHRDDASWRWISMARRVPATVAKVGANIQPRMGTMIMSW